MQLKVNGKDRELKFNMGFIRRLDDMYVFNKDGMRFGAGIALGYPMLEQRSPVALADFCRCAIQEKVSESQIDEALDAYAEANDGLESLFDGVIGELGKSSVVKAMIKKLEQQTEEQQAKK